MECEEVGLVNSRELCEAGGDVFENKGFVGVESRDKELDRTGNSE